MQWVHPLGVCPKVSAPLTISDKPTISLHALPTTQISFHEPLLRHMRIFHNIPQFLTVCAHISHHTGTHAGSHPCDPSQASRHPGSHLHPTTHTHFPLILATLEPPELLTSCWECVILFHNIARHRAMADSLHALAPPTTLAASQML